MNRDSFIAAQVAVKGAVELAVASGEASDFDIAGNASMLYGLIYELAGDAPAQSNVVPMHPAAQAAPDPMATITETFTAPSGQQPVVMNDIPPAQPVSASSPKEVLWADALFHNPNDWWNNVGDPKAKSGGGNGPDVKSKSLKDGKYFVGLWIDSKDTPDWVHQRLGA